jgi:hypothetical protein
MEVPDSPSSRGCPAMWGSSPPSTVLPLQQTKRKQMNYRTRSERKEMKDYPVSSALLSGVGTSPPPRPRGSSSLLDRTSLGKVARIFARACIISPSSRFPARLLSTIPAAHSSASYCGGRDAPAPGPHSRTTSTDYRFAARTA